MPEKKITERAVTPSTKDVLLCVLFIVGWLLPVSYTGFTRKKIEFLPRSFTYFHSIGNLFTHSVPVWPMPYIQIQAAGQSDWITLPEEEYFQLTTFGYRTRFFEALYLATNIPDYEKKSLGVQSELARWIVSRYRSNHPQAPDVQKIRFVAGLYKIDQQKPPQGHWQLPAYETFAPDQTYILSTHDS